MAQNGYYSIDDCVGQAIISLDVSESHVRAKFTAWASWWVVNQYYSKYRRNVKAVNIDVPTSGNLWVQVPDDFDDWVRVGIQFGDVLRQLDYNDKLVTLAPNSKTQPRYGSTDAAALPPDALYFGNSPYWNGNGWGSVNWYGWGQGEYNGQFKYDQVNKRLIFAYPWPEKDSQIYLEYFYIPNNNHNGATITPIAADALVQYLIYRYYLSKRDLPMKREHEMMYTKEMRNFVSNEKSDRAYQLLAAINANTNAGVV